jgi:hypothetical protein
MEIISSDVWDIIANLHNDLKAMLTLKSCCKFLNRLLITNLFNIDNKYLQLLNNDVLCQPIFSNVVKLDVTCNNNVTDISFMKNLKILCANFSMIDQNSINGLDLIELEAIFNLKITHASLTKK